MIKRIWDITLTVSDLKKVLIFIQGFLDFRKNMNLMIMLDLIVVE